MKDSDLMYDKTLKAVVLSSGFGTGNIITADADAATAGASSVAGGSTARLASSAGSGSSGSESGTESLPPLSLLLDLQIYCIRLLTRMADLQIAHAAAVAAAAAAAKSTPSSPIPGLSTPSVNGVSLTAATPAPPQLSRSDLLQHQQHNSHLNSFAAGWSFGPAHSVIRRVVTFIMENGLYILVRHAQCHVRLNPIPPLPPVHAADKHHPHHPHHSHHPYHSHHHNSHHVTPGRANPYANLNVSLMGMGGVGLAGVQPISLGPSPAAFAQTVAHEAAYKLFETYRDKLHRLYKQLRYVLCAVCCVLGFDLID